MAVCVVESNFNEPLQFSKFLEEFTLTKPNSTNRTPSLIIRKLHFSCEADTLLNILHECKILKIEKFVDKFFEPKWLRLRNYWSGKGEPSYKKILSDNNSVLEYEEFTTKEEIQARVNLSTARKYAELETTRVTLLDEDNGSSKRKIYIDLVHQKEGDYLIVGGLSISGQELQEEFTDQFSAFYSSLSQETLAKIIYPTLSKIKFTQNEKKDQKYQPIIVAENPLSNYIISSKDNANKLGNWLFRMERGKFKEYSTLFRGYNGFSLRSVNKLTLKELGVKEEDIESLHKAIYTATIGSVAYPRLAEVFQIPEDKFCNYTNALFLNYYTMDQIVSLADVPKEKVEAYYKKSYFFLTGRTWESDQGDV